MRFPALLLTLLPLVNAAPSTITPSHPPAPATEFYYGHDLSSLALLEEGGAIYKDTARGNATRSADAILGDGGMNTVRLRIWVNPSDGVYGLQYNLDLATRMQAAGYKIYLDFHFS